jgi:hypothetical protein
VRLRDARGAALPCDTVDGVCGPSSFSVRALGVNTGDASHGRKRQRPRKPLEARGGCRVTAMTRGGSALVRSLAAALAVVLSLATAASADVLVDPSHLSGRCIKLGVCYQSFSGGPHSVTVTVYRGNVKVAQRRLAATTTWRSYTLTCPAPRALRRRMWAFLGQPRDDRTGGCLLFQHGPAEKVVWPLARETSTVYDRRLI